VAKLHYLVSGTYYLGGIATTLTIWLPIFFLFFQLYAIRMPFSGVLIHIAPYAIVSTLIFSIVQLWYSHDEERGFAWRSAVLEKATWNIYLRAFLNAVQGRKVPYLPTPKEGSGAPIPRLVWPHWLAIVLSVLAIAWVPLTYHRIDDGTLLMVFFAAINVLMLLPVSWIGIRGLFRRKRATATAARPEEALA
jgi:cellulose synthase (UDP-forming)